MDKFRKYGDKPFRVAVIHGGPGAPGEVAPVARELSVDYGVLEPFQSADTCEGQVLELKAVLEESADLPVTLVGHSWGAMLSFMLAARYPALVRKLVMVSSAVFEDKYAAELEVTRLTRMNDTDRVELLTLMASLDDPTTRNKDIVLSRFSQLLWAKADSYDPLALDIEVLRVDYGVNISIMAEARRVRSSGELLEMGKHIECPVVAIHGDYDSHPAEGVREPLSRVVKDFRFILLEKCGHFPWLERYARDRFYEVLKKEITG